MKRQELERYSTYFESEAGQFDFGFFDSGMLKAANTDHVHIVDIDVGGKSHLFLRSKQKKLTLDPVIQSVLTGLKSDKKRVAFLEAVSASRYFSFNSLGKEVSFSNLGGLQEYRTIDSGTTVATDVVLSRDLIERATDEPKTGWYKDLAGFMSTGSNRGSFPISLIREKVKEKDLLWFEKFSASAGLTTLGSVEDPLLVSALPAFTWKTPYVVFFVNDDDSLDVSDAAVYGANTKGQVVYCSVFANGETARYVLNLVFGQMIGVVDFATKVFTKPKGYGWFDEVLQSLKSQGMKVTGRYSGLLGHGPMAGSLPLSAVMVKAQDGTMRLSMPGRVGTGPYWGPGKGSIIVHTRLGGVCFEVEHRINQTYDTLVFFGERSGERYKATLMQSIWNGGSVAATYVSASEAILSKTGSNTTLFATSKELSSDGCTLDVPWSESLVRTVDPLNGSRSIERVDILTNSSISEGIYLSQDDVRMLQGMGRDQYYYLPLSAFLHGGDVFSVGTFTLESDTSLVTRNGYAEGEQYNSDLEVKYEPSDDFGVVEPGTDEFPRFDSVFEEDPDNEPGSAATGKRETLIRYSVIRCSQPVSKYRGFSFNASSVSTLKTGQGLGVPLNSQQVKDLERLAGEMGSRSLAGVSYKRGITVPFNVTDRLQIARDYAKAKKKACQPNDWDKTYYVGKITWGSVKNTMNSRKSLTSVYCITDVNSTALEAFDIETPTSMKYVVGSNPARIAMSYPGGVVKEANIDNQDILWEGIAAGAPLTGITLAGVSNSWGYEDEVATDDTRSMKKATAEVVRSASDRKAAMTGGHYVFDPSVLAVNGFPDIPYMPVESGWKAMIASVIICESAGKVLENVVFDVPRTLRDQYQGSALIRIARIRGTKSK